MHTHILHTHAQPSHANPPSPPPPRYTSQFLVSPSNTLAEVTPSLGVSHHNGRKRVGAEWWSVIHPPETSPRSLPQSIKDNPAPSHRRSGPPPASLPTACSLRPPTLSSSVRRHAGPGSQSCCKSPMSMLSVPSPPLVRRFPFV